MGNILRAFEIEKREHPWNEFLQACAFGISSKFHTNLQASQGHDVRFQENWDNQK
jgi:hypothetical protein